MNNFRLFLGIQLPDPLKSTVGPAAEAMAAQCPFRSWTVPPDYHVTLHFFGDMPQNDIATIGNAAADIARSASPFELQLTAPGTFGPAERPRVLWIGLAPSPALSRLHTALTDRLKSNGYPVEARPYSPHVTLARNAGPGFDKNKLADAWSTAIGSAGSLGWTVDSLTLFRSHIGRRPSYEPIGSWPFGPKPNE